jgi:hypothetical protein
VIESSKKTAIKKAKVAIKEGRASNEIMITINIISFKIKKIDFL